MLPMLDHNCPNTNITTNSTQPWTGVNSTAGYGEESGDDGNGYVYTEVKTITAIIELEENTYFRNMSISHK